jgi:hypothetical protein
MFSTPELSGDTFEPWQVCKMLKYKEKALT